MKQFEAANLLMFSLIMDTTVRERLIRGGVVSLNLSQLTTFANLCVASGLPPQVDCATGESALPEGVTMDAVGELVEGLARDNESRRAARVEAQGDRASRHYRPSDLGSTGDNARAAAERYLSQRAGETPEPFAGIPPATPVSDYRLQALALIGGSRELPALKFYDQTGNFLDRQGWRATHDGNGDTAFAPIHKNGEVIALAVATGDADKLPAMLDAHCAAIVDQASRISQFEAWADIERLVREYGNLPMLGPGRTRTMCLHEIGVKVAKFRVDAERWQEVCFLVGGDRANNGMQFFTLDLIPPLPGANIMQGSVMQHFTEAVDAQVKARKESK